MNARTLLFAIAVTCSTTAVGEDDSRHTETVKLIERSLPAVVSVRSFVPTDKPETTTIHHGSGSVIHPSGYVLTNAHVIKNPERGEVEFSDRRVLPYRLIARFPHEDLAIVKVNSDKPFITQPLGRSNDLMLGEPVVVIGNPGGLGHSVSTGIISGLARSSNTQDAFLPSLVQTSAAVNGGNSGGPLLNALGQQIGIITSRKDDAENINFAITIDRFRDCLPAMIAAEQRYGFWLGCEIARLETIAKVLEIIPDSPAAKAGLAAGDAIAKVDGAVIRDGVDWQLMLIDRKPGDKLAIEVTRDGKPVLLELTLAPLPLSEPVAAANTTGGIQLAFYPGKFDRLPDFEKLAPTIEHPTAKAGLDTITGGRDDFALRFTGFLKAPVDGLYTFYLSSDDGSRLILDGRRTIDHDGMHPNREAAGLVRLKAGLHPITVEYFESGGGESLQLSWEYPEQAKQEVPAGVYFVPATATAPNVPASPAG